MANNLEFRIEYLSVPDNDIVVAVDSTEMKVAGRGDWMREKHGIECKGWIRSMSLWIWKRDDL